MADDTKEILGTWSVRVQDWVWEYKFAPGGALTWRDTTSSEKGAGRWALTAKSINVTWPDSTTKESWSRPLNPTGNVCSYKSTYYTGNYEAKRLDPKPVWQRKFGRQMPPYIRQGSTALCWAASMSSWLRTVPGRDNLTVPDLLERFSPYLVDGEGLKGEHFDKVANNIKIRMDFEKITGATFTEEYVAYALSWSNLYVVTKSGATISHARVVFGMQEGGVGVMDPMQGFKGWTYDQIKNIDVMLVGWAKGRILGQICKPESGMYEYL